LYNVLLFAPAIAPNSDGKGALDFMLSFKICKKDWFRETGNSIKIKFVYSKQASHEEDLFLSFQNPEKCVQYLTAVIKTGSKSKTSPVSPRASGES
jgi:hypothetical protein